MKFSTTDQRYLQARKDLSQKYGERELWSVIDQWPLYCGIANMARTLAISDILRSTLDVPGHIAEFGSWQGSNLMFMAKLLRILDPWSSKVVHCFDSFQGLSEFAAQDGSTSELKGKYKGSLEELLDLISLYELNDEIYIHKGLIEETLPKFIEANAQVSFSLVYLDTDLYESTRIAMETLHPHLSKGAVFVLDEWNHEKWPGEGKAANEFLKKFGDFYEMEHVKLARQPTLVLRKTKI